MKRFTSIQFVVLMTALLSISFAGCKKTPKGVTPIPGRASEVPGTRDTSGVTNGGRPTPGNTIGEDPSTQTRPFNPNENIPISDTSREEIENMLADRDTFKANTAYFDFDRANVRASEKSKIEAVATYLKGEPRFKVQVEGHCDERGTDEYNRSLGERRALGVREYLVSLGIAPERVFTISWGEQKPADPGMDEAAWAKNRRAEFVLLKPKN